MLTYIRFADALSAAFGKAFAWLIMMMPDAPTLKVPALPAIVARSSASASRRARFLRATDGNDRARAAATGSRYGSYAGGFARSNVRYTRAD